MELRQTTYLALTSFIAISFTADLLIIASMDSELHAYSIWLMTTKYVLPLIFWALVTLIIRALNLNPPIKRIDDSEP